MLLKCRTHKLRRELSLFAKIIVTCRADGFIQNLLQLKQVLEMRHGVMVVGKAGKSVALEVLTKVLEKLDSTTKGKMYVIGSQSDQQREIVWVFWTVQPLHVQMV